MHVSLHATGPRLRCCFAVLLPLDKKKKTRRFCSFLFFFARSDSPFLSPFFWVVFTCQKNACSLSVGEQVVQQRQEVGALLVSNCGLLSEIDVLTHNLRVLSGKTNL